MTIGVPVLGTPDQDTVAAANSTPAFPAVAADDCLLLLGAGASGAPNMVTTIPTGFTLDMQHCNNVDTVSPWIGGFHKVAAGTESGVLSVDHGSMVSSFGIVGVSGVDPTTPVESATFVDVPVGAQTWTLPSVNVAEDGATLLYVASANNIASTFTPPTGWNELWDGTVNTPNSRAWSIGYKQNVAAGASGTADLKLSSTVRGEVILYVLKPAAVPAPTYSHFALRGGVWVPTTRQIGGHGQPWV